MKRTPSPALLALQYANILAAGWRRILFCGVAAFLAGVAVLLMAPRNYQSMATLAVYPPPFREAGGTQEIASLMPSLMHVRDYGAIITSDAAFDMVREMLPLGALPPKARERYSNIVHIRKALSASIEINEKTAQRTDYSKIIQLKAKSGDPETAAVLANTWASVTQQLINEYSALSKQASAQYLVGEHRGVGESLEDYEDQHQSAENQYAEMLVSYDIHTESMKLDMDNETERLVKELEDRQDQEMRALMVKHQLSMKEAELLYLEWTVLDWEEQLRLVRKAKNDAQERLKQLEAEAEKQGQFVVESKSITDEALWERVNVEASGGGLPPELESLRLRQEVLNPVHTHVMELVADTRVDLHSLPQEETYLLAQLTQERERFDELYRTISDGEFEIAEAERRHLVDLERLKRERETERKTLVSTREQEREALSRMATLAVGRLHRELENQKQKYNLLSSQALNANLALADSTMDIAAIGRAVPVDEPHGVPRTFMALLFGMFGVLAGIAWVLAEFVHQNLLPRLQALGLPGQHDRRNGKDAEEALVAKV